LLEAEQQVIDRGAAVGATPGIADGALAAPERAARSTLRGQIARLERELSAIVADTFPHITPVPEADAAPSGPSLLGLAELERTRDRLAARVQDLRALAGLRAEYERRAREQLRRMKLEPGRYKWVRLPVSDLGEGGCGVWEVRPRLGLIGMLAGWWQLKLSSGCPLPKGQRPRRCPIRPRRASPRA
jgi:hypothetical protein